MACWTELAHKVQAEQQGLSALVWGQRVESPGLLLQPSGRRGRRYTGRAGGQVFRLRRRGLDLTSGEGLQG